MHVPKHHFVHYLHCIKVLIMLNYFIRVAISQISLYNLRSLKCSEDPAPFPELPLAMHIEY